MKILYIIFILCAIFQNNQAMQNNNQYVLLSPDTILEVVKSPTSLKENIKVALHLRQTCKDYNLGLSLKKVGNSLKHYSQEEKDAALKKLLACTHDHNYHNKRQAALMLIYAGANNMANRTYSFLERATHQNDAEAIAILFENGANPNQKPLSSPDFFAIKSVAIANIFMTKGIELNTSSSAYPNVLWKNIMHSDSPDLVALYIEQGVDVKKIEPYNNSCILHFLADIKYRAINTKYIEISKLLLVYASDMINNLNSDKQTPLNILQANSLDDNSADLQKQLITLFKSYGAKTARELTN